MNRLSSVADLKNLRTEIIKNRDREKLVISICAGTGCRAYKCMSVFQTFREEIFNSQLDYKVEIKLTGCHGFCERGPLITIRPQNILYQRVTPEDVPNIIQQTILKGNIIKDLLYVNPVNGNLAFYEDDVPFYKEQQRIIFGSNGVIDPTNIDDYLATGGYTALAKILSEMKPEDVIEQIKKSGLRGRGGGGFPTGKKWESCRNVPAHDDIRYIICNADEGDPGAYMDRSLLEGNPHIVIEGMIIGAYAIGSRYGYVYVRNEYPLAVENLDIALKQARNYGFLGEKILNFNFDFDIIISKGGGAFVCGESTALIASIEGKPGEPRPKYIHTVESGLYNKPTIINNVETWANVPVIINKGADWYNVIGTENSKGTKIFSLVGKINNTGLVEVPMGMTLRKIIFDIGGGIPDGKKFKAVQTGGPSGGCIPEDLIDLPVDFDKLTEVGSMMGSGGMIVMDENTCMVDMARYFINFLTYESCGKCVPCREGLKKILDILTYITKGEGREEDVELLLELCEFIKETALCALGRSAPNPVLSTIRYFRNEYDAHIKEKKCFAGVCKALITFIIIPKKCVGCGRCIKYCSYGAISGKKKYPHKIDPQRCIKCGICRENCKFEAITIG